MDIRIFVGLVVALTGCGARQATHSSDDDTGASVDGSESSSSESSSSESSGTSEDDAADDDDDPLKYDVGATKLDSNLPPPGDCTVMLSSSMALENHPECPIMPDDDDGSFCGTAIYIGCVEPDPGQTCARLCPEGDCIADWWNCEGDRAPDAPDVVCGPYEIDGLCCTIAQIANYCSDIAG
jgi:hypothetical protein